MNLSNVALATANNGNNNERKLADPGVYKGYIMEAKAGVCSTGTKKVDFTVELTDRDDKKHGRLWFSLYDSPANFCQIQWQRLLTALYIPLEGELSMEEIASLAEKNSITVKVIQEERDGYKPRLAPDANDFEFATIDDFENLDMRFNQGITNADTSFMDIPEEAGDEIDFSTGTDVF